MAFTPIWLFSPGGHTDNTTLNLEWDGSTNSTSVQINTSIKRHGRASLRNAQSTAGPTKNLTLPTPGASTGTFLLFALYMTDLGNGVSRPHICIFANGAGNQASIQCYSDGSIGMFRGANSGTLVGSLSAAGVLRTGAWMHVGVWLHAADSGQMVVWVDGSQVLSNTGDFLSNTTVPALSQVILAGASLSTYYQDVIVGSGAAADFPGDLIVEDYPLAGNGSGSGFSVTGAASLYQAVDENGPNGATDYIEAAAAGAKQVFTLTNPGIAGNIIAVQVTPFAATDTGSASLRGVIKSGASEAAGSTGTANTGTYAARQHALFTTDPATGSAWTTAAVAAAEAGVERTA